MIIRYYVEHTKNEFFHWLRLLLWQTGVRQHVNEIHHRWELHGHERRLKVPLFPPQNVIDLCKCWKHFIKYDNNDRHVQWESDKPEEYTTGRLASIFSSSWEFSALSCFRVFDRAAKSPNTSTASLAVPFLNKQNKSRLIYTRSN